MAEEKNASAGTVDASNVPADFAEQIAVKITVIHEKEMDPAVSSENSSQFVYESVNHPKLYRYLFDATDFLLDDERTTKFIALTWAALHINQDIHPEYEDFVRQLVAYSIQSYAELERPEVEINKKKYSGYAHIYGCIFGKMIDVNNNLFDVIQNIYSSILSQEMEEEGKDDEKDSRLIAFKKPKKKNAAKKLYDDIIDYVANKGSFKSSSLNQENPNEHLLVLADRLRGTRRYVMQDLMNKRALDRKKQVEKELSERLSSAEEIILASDPFREGLSLFWQEKRYNYKFLAVEKIRISLQIIGTVIGVGYAMSGYLGVGDIHWLQGLFICGGMWGFVKVFGSRKRFKGFYPYDVSKELEVCVGNFATTMRRMSKEQLNHFLARQIKLKQNQAFIPVIPEFVKYLYAVMPDRKSMIITIDQLAEVMELIEIDVAKQLRSRM